MVSPLPAVTLGNDELIFQRYNMTIRTTIQIGALVAILASGLYLLDEHLDRQQKVQAQVQRVFDLDVDPIVALTFKHDQMRMELVQIQNRWFLQAPVRARANQPVVERIIMQLEGLRRSSSIHAAGRQQQGLRLEDYGLEPAHLRLSIETRGGRSQVLLIGDATPFDDHLFACLAGSDEVFTLPATVLERMPSDPSDLRDRSIVHGNTDKVERLDIYRRDAGLVRVVRERSGWMLQQPLSGRANADAVQSLLDKLFSINVASFFWDAEVSDEDNMEALGLMERELINQIESAGLASDAAPMRIAVWTDDDRLGQEIFFGNVTGEGDERYVFLRKTGVDTIYQVESDVLDAFRIPSDSLRDRTIFPFRFQDIRSIRLQRSDSLLEVYRDGGKGDDRWLMTVPVRSRSDHEMINALIHRLLRLQVASYDTDGLDPDYQQAEDDWLSITLSTLLETETTGGENETTTRSAANGSVTLLLAPHDPALPEGRLARVVHRDEWFWVDLESVDRLDAGIVSPLAFADRKVLSVDSSKVFRIQRETAESTLRIEKNREDSSSQWRIVDETPTVMAVDHEAVEHVLSRVSRLEALQFVAFMPSSLAPFGLKEPKASLTFGLRDAETLQNTLLIGKESGDDRFYAMVRGRHFVFLLPRSTVEHLLLPLAKRLPSEAPVVSEKPSPTPLTEESKDE